MFGLVDEMKGRCDTYFDYPPWKVLAHNHAQASTLLRYKAGDPHNPKDSPLPIAALIVVHDMFHGLTAWNAAIGMHHEDDIFPGIEYSPRRFSQQLYVFLNPVRGGLAPTDARVTNAIGYPFSASELATSWKASGPCYAPGTKDKGKF
jgi:hypothetical protein